MSQKLRTLPALLAQRTPFNLTRCIMNIHRTLSAPVTAIIASCYASLVAASGCPFDSPTAGLTREGLVLSRYASGVNGIPLVANSGFAAGDASMIQGNIVAMADQLDINRNGSFDATDATIISRRIAGFSSAAATSGIPAANLGPGGAAAVESFLLTGCGSTSWLIGGNPITADSMIGTPSAFNLSLSTGGQNIRMTQGNGHGLRVSKTSAGQAPNIINGNAANVHGNLVEGSTVAGGGGDQSSCRDPLTGMFNRSCRNSAQDSFATVGGGIANDASGAWATVAGGESNTADWPWATVSGGTSNRATGDRATVSGGSQNTASGAASTVPGGFLNNATGFASFAVGRLATAADRSFVWNSYASPNNLPDRTDSFRVQAANGVDFSYGPNRDHFVAFNVDTAGAIIVTSTGARLTTGGVWQDNSDRALKRDFATLNPRRVLHKLLQLPITTWSYAAEDRSVRHMGPMAQDFRRLFGLGYDDKTMNAVDRAGVAFAAIQGLHSLVKEKDAVITALEARLKRLEARLDAVTAKR